MLECRVCQNRWRRHFEVFSCRATAASEAPTDKDTAPSKLGRKRGGWSHRGRNYFEGAACAIPIRRSRTVSHQGHLSAVKGSARVKTTMLLRHGGTPSLAIEQRRRCHRRSPIAFAHEPTYVSHSTTYRRAAVAAADLPHAFRQIWGKTRVSTNDKNGE